MPNTFTESWLCQNPAASHWLGSSFSLTAPGRCHRERGNGIFAVADSFDAITSDRPYRRASPFDAGRETIQREAGRLFDPQIVSLFLSIPAETWSRIARDQGQMAALPSQLRQDNAILRPDASLIP